MSEAIVRREQSSLAPIYSLDEMWRMATALAKSNLYGIKIPEQWIALMLVANAEGKHPCIVARDYDVIQGRPSKKSEALMRDFLSAGGSVKWNRLDDECADATFSHPQGGTVRITWDMARATKAGLAGKDNWKKGQRRMLSARCISEGVRTICPDATSGLPIPEEAADFEPVTAVVVEQPPAQPAPPAPPKTQSRRLKEAVGVKTAPAPQAPVAQEEEIPFPEATVGREPGEETDQTL